jgi:hypothetical protein
MRHIDAITLGQNFICIKTNGRAIMIKLVASAPSLRPKAKRRKKYARRLGIEAITEERTPNIRVDLTSWRFSG